MCSYQDMRFLFFSFALVKFRSSTVPFLPVSPCVYVCKGTRQLLNFGAPPLSQLAALCKAPVPFRLGEGLHLRFSCLLALAAKQVHVSHRKLSSSPSLSSHLITTILLYIATYSYCEFIQIKILLLTSSGRLRV